MFSSVCLKPDLTVWETQDRETNRGRDILSLLRAELLRRGSGDEARLMTSQRRVAVCGAGRAGERAVCGAGGAEERAVCGAGGAGERAVCAAGGAGECRAVNTGATRVDPGGGV